MLLFILTETKIRGVVPRGHLCSGGGQGCHWAGPHRGTQGWAAAVQMVPPPPSPPQPLPKCGHLQMCTMGRWGETLPRVDYGEALAPLKALPR